MNHTHTINDFPFSVEEYRDGWGWTDLICDRESEGSFPTQSEALQDAVNYTRKIEQHRKHETEQDADEARFGSYEQQVEAEWKAGRL